MLFQGALTLKCKLHGRCLKRRPPGELRSRDTAELNRQGALRARGLGEPILGQIREQQHEQRLGPFAGDAAIHIDFRLGGLSGLTLGARHEGDIGTADLTVQIERRLGVVAIGTGEKTGANVEGNQRRQMLRFADVLGKAEQVGKHAQTVGGLRL